jgi:hypothetical protein
VLRKTTYLLTPNVPISLPQTAQPTMDAPCTKGNRCWYVASTWVLALCAGFCAAANTPPIPPPPTAVHLPERQGPLLLSLVPTVQLLEPAPASVLSPIFRAYVNASLNAGLQVTDKERLRQPESGLGDWLFQAGSASLSVVCILRGSNSPGLGVRWSLNDGLGFYVQGKPFMQLKRLVEIKKANICPPGDASPVCRDLPRRMCDE